MVIYSLPFLFYQLISSHSYFNNYTIEYSLPNPLASLYIFSVLFSYKALNNTEIMKEFTE